MVSDWVNDRDNARGALAERLRAVGRLLNDGIKIGSSTPLNQPIGPHRRFDWCIMDMERIKQIKRIADASVNDVVLAIVTGAVRRYLHDSRGTALEGIDFRVLAPVSVRRDDHQGQMGNHVSGWIVDLPIDEPDPLEQLRKIHEITGELKRTRQALAAETLTEAAAWTGPTLLSLGSRLMALGQPFNMVVTNVPGPQQTLYLLESPMLEVIPMVPLMGTLTTGIALFSYAGKLCWGVTADWDLVPDLHDLVLALQRAFEELGQAADQAARRAEVTRPEADHEDRQAGDEASEALAN
jgi:WS/DGAT/MGAT family acyltransferase